MRPRPLASAPSRLATTPWMSCQPDSALKGPARLLLAPARLRRHESQTAVAAEFATEIAAELAVGQIACLQGQLWCPQGGGPVGCWEPPGESTAIGALRVTLKTSLDGSALRPGSKRATTVEPPARSPAVGRANSRYLSPTPLERSGFAFGPARAANACPRFSSQSHRRRPWQAALPDSPTALQRMAQDEARGAQNHCLNPCFPLRPWALTGDCERSRTPCVRVALGTTTLWHAPRL